jgi:hypothetical protein
MVQVSSRVRYRWSLKPHSPSVVVIRQLTTAPLIYRRFLNVSASAVNASSDAGRCSVPKSEP